MTAGRINSRAKGATFERQVATDLRAWLGEGWTVMRNPTDKQAGQLAAVAGEFTIEGPYPFPFAVECKAVEAFDPAQLWRAEVPDAVAKLWRQAVRQADKVDRRPLLVVKRNHAEVLCCLRSADAAALFGVVPVPCMYLLMGDAVTVVRWAALERARWGEM